MKRGWKFTVALEKETLGSGGGDDQILQWAFTHGCKPSGEEIEIWNDYLSKRGWRDQDTPRLHFRLREACLPIDSALTMFDCKRLDPVPPALKPLVLVCNS